MRVVLNVLLFPVALVWVLRWKLLAVLALWWGFGWVFGRQL